MGYVYVILLALFQFLSKNRYMKSFKLCADTIYLFRWAYGARYQLFIIPLPTTHLLNLTSLYSSLSFYLSTYKFLYVSLSVPHIPLSLSLLFPHLTHILTFL